MALFVHDGDNMSTGNTEGSIKCYKCGSTLSLKPCGTCRKYMCADCRKKYWDRLGDFVYEKRHGYNEAWYKEGQIKL